jgi:hypothetical protein
MLLRIEIKLGEGVFSFVVKPPEYSENQLCSLFVLSRGLKGKRILGLMENGKLE